MQASVITQRFFSFTPKGAILTTVKIDPERTSAARNHCSAAFTARGVHSSGSMSAFAGFHLGGTAWGGGSSLRLLGAPRPHGHSQRMPNSNPAGLSELQYS